MGLTVLHQHLRGPFLRPACTSFSHGAAAIGAVGAVCALVLLAAACRADAGPAPTPPTGVLDIRFRAPTGKVVSDLHFAANVEFYRPGLAAGVGDRGDDFARALRASGVRVLRFPGGNAAYWYLPESRSATMSLCPPHVRSMDFVGLEQLARFARESGIPLIYELPCLFYLDGDVPRAIVHSSYSDKLGHYDHDRVEEGAAYGLSVARRLLDLGAPIVAWELGNEEFAHCAVQDYAEVVAAYVEGLAEIDPETPVVAVGMGEGWLDGLVPMLREAGALPRIRSFQVHYPFGNWPGPGPGSPEGKADPAAFVGGNLKMERFLDAFSGRKQALGIGDLPTSVTETTVMRHQLWDPHAVVGTHAHALCYAWNWMALLERAEVDVAVFHDLETPFFGILRYNVGFDAEHNRFVWLDQTDDTTALARRFPREYVLSPTGHANRLLSELVGEELWETDVAPSPVVRVIGSAQRLLVVNRSAESLSVVLPFAGAAGEALVADGLAACLPGSYRYTPLRVAIREGRPIATVPAWSIAVARRQ